MGSEFIQNASLFDPTRGWTPVSDNRPTAGELYANFVKTGAISDDTLRQAKESLGAVRQAILSGDETRIVKPVRELLHAMLLAYFHQSDETTNAMGKLAQVATAHLPSFGATFLGLSTQYYFGLPRSVKGAGYFIDIDSLSYSVTGQDAVYSGVQFLQILGRMLSAFEHGIPEKLFSTDTIRREGVSAVKLLSEANRLGQKIYKVDSSNVDTVLPQVNVSPDIKSEISSAVAAGKRAIVHQQNTTISGWTGAGYIIADPEEL